MTKKKKKEKRMSFARKMGRKKRDPALLDKVDLDIIFNIRYNKTRF